ncbi:Sodium/calcium exchanger membrane region [Penicillium macrosclerotiorum]|uniref:Sodium/calcium exchanger membrane region n=1 Tax=Penicillium macrosclerotiorum TaxID=303699 RepID=UPI00254726BA|nr:Sodium/calcium exchanger membrane region [Penicillium macrosclerotiorum]KAJ5675792.1 Sodium/calcium exchanger membrane region [Penicillium macrosclerotiorum]
MTQLPIFLRPVVRKGPRYSVRPFYASLLVFTALAILSWSVAKAGSGQVREHSTTEWFLARREDEPECRLVRNSKDQCAYVRDNCPDHQDGLLSYLQLYYCALSDAKPLAFIIIILWLSLLFSTIGIAASDFLCIDLSTLASILGLSESLTGVTFLAFGNGSPDVFSTFAAMRSNSGSLAIGELIGAASFITSVVAGSMALVRPFKVARRSFVRDVGYFVIAVSFSMFLLADGRLHVWESATMVALYAFYVVMVVTWHWYLVRRRRRYERDLAARTHFHIPNNQELEVEHPIEDDDPGVASESRSLLRGASTDDFDLLERAEWRPSWKDEDDEDDETRNRYLAEIRDNMHVYRPPIRSRRNTLNPIRPSLVGALEFQSVLQALQKSQTSIHRPTISLSSYSDDGNDSSQTFDTRSIASHPRARKPANSNDRLTPYGAEGSRARAVSANYADGLKLDTSLFDRPQQENTPLLTVRRPSGERAGSQDRVEPPRVPRIDTSALLTASPSSSEYPSPSASPIGDNPAQNLLAPPDPFHAPNYQSTTTHDRSPLPISPRGGTGSSFAGFGSESPSTPFPIYTDTPSASSSRAPSIRLPNPATSPSEQLLIHDGMDGMTESSSFHSLKKWWPSSILPPPSIIGCTLFPTLAGWKDKSIAARLLGIIAAPSVFLLTITIPVIEPQAPEPDERDPIPAVVIEPVNDNNCSAPRIRLPADSPVLQPMGHDHEDLIPDIASAQPHSHRKSTHHQSTSRPRWDSELPAAPPAGLPLPSRDWNRWLIMIQLFTGPFFFTLIAWTTADASLDPRNLILPTLISLLFSLLCLTALIITTRRRSQPQPESVQLSYFSHGSPKLPVPQSLPSGWRPFLSLLGFLVAISWIATIATEVVSVLKTLGVILDISDSLLGLTIFAVGNSLGDLVADITVARLGYPVMALSACFGGPMLNILLGIGLGGLYMTMNGGSKTPRNSEMAVPVRVPYEIAISKVLVISGATLLVVLVGLLIVVPLNNWRMDRRIGWGLVVVWCVSTLGNVIAEVTL